MDIEEITGPGKSGETDRLSHPAAPLIEQAMMGYGVPGASVHHDEPEREIRLGYLRAKARSAYQSYQVTRYDATGRILPELIRDVETATRMAGAASPAACAVRALVYDTAAPLLSRVGEPFLAWAASDHAMAAAEYSGDPLLAAVGAWRLSYVITGRKHPQQALDLAMTAASTLEHSSDHYRPSSSASTAPCTWLLPPQRRQVLTGRRQKRCWRRRAASLTTPDR